MKKSTYISTAAILLLSATPAFAGETYIAGSVGIANQSSSDNTGETGAFTTGNLGDGSTLDVAAGTDYGWNTEFDSGSTFAVEIGKKMDTGLRFGLEGVRTKADVDTHTGVTLGANVYYDFNKAGVIQPYLGGGVGVSSVDVDYQPSGIAIIDDGQTKFAYQGKAGEQSA